MPAKYSWEFRPRFRSGGFRWNGSRLAGQRLQEAVAEIKAVAKTDPVTAADGVVTLMERIWPAFQYIDTSSGALGGAVCWAQEELFPIVSSAPADAKTRDKWLKRLWQAIEDDGVSYLALVEERWGELCGSPEVASAWADEFLAPVRANWSKPKSGYMNGGSLCLSSLLAAGRHQEIFDLLEVSRHKFWLNRAIGVRALLKEGRIDDALSYAEASRGMSQPNDAIDAACERILLDAGRPDEAYEKYALTANEASTGLATFRAIAKKYPLRDPKKILLDLATSSGETGRWFASAKTAGFLDLALEFAVSGRTDPRTLSRAARDMIQKDPEFCLHVGRLAIERMLDGDGYEIASADIEEAYDRFLAAAEKLGAATAARNDVLALASGVPKAPKALAELSRVLIRRCSRR